MLTLICLCIASLSTALIVAADESTIISSEYSGGATYEMAQEGGVFYATGIAHAAMIQFNFKDGMTLNETDHTYVHMKGIVSSNVTRIKLNSVYLVYTSSPSRGSITFDENGVFEYHAQLTASGPEGAYFAYDGEDHFAFQMYVDGDNATLEMLGVVFNNEETYSNWATPYEPEEHVHDWSTEWSHNASTHWHACLNNCGEKSEESEHTFVDGACSVCSRPAPAAMAIGDIVVPESSESATFSVSKDETTGYQTVTYSGTIGYSYYAVTITDLEAGKDTLNIVFENEASVELFYKINGAENWTIGYTTYQAGVNTQAIPVSANEEGHVVVEFLIDASTTAESAKSVVFTYIGFDAPEVEKPAIEDITTKSSATITKDETTGYQTITYTESPGWNDFDIVINEFDSSKTYLKLTFSNENAIPVNLFYILNGVEKGDIGWKAYGAGENVEYISLEGAELSAPWTFSFFLDSNEEVTGQKTVVIKSIEFVTEDDLPKAPEGLYFTTTTEGGITCVTNANDGWDITWNNDSSSWRNVSFVINNYETDYDILKLNLTATAGTNVGIRWHYLFVDDEGETPLYARVRTHDGVEGIVGESGELELVYLAKAYNMKGLVQTKVEVWFDCPTGTSTNVGAQSATVNSIELLKSSEINFSDLTITANDMAVDFTGEPVEFIASASAEVDLKVEYEVVNAETGKAEWTGSAPSNAGEYNVRVTFMGSLTYDYQVVTAKLTINKVKAVISAEDVTVDAESRVVTIAEGVIASTDEDFIEGFEVLNGATVNYGTVIYYKRPADDNHIESDVLSLTVTRPVIPEDSSSTGGETPETSENETKIGCFSSVVGLGVEMIIALVGAVVIFAKKRR